MGKKVNIGVIGAGSIGSVHTEAYGRIADVANVVALCDILPDKLAEKAKRHSIGKTYTDYHDLLADPEIEAVSVCVPNCVHAPIAIDALKAGKHVMLEKPMSLSAKLAQDIVDARDASGKILQVGMVRRQENEVAIVKKMIDDGRLGEVYQIRVKLIRRRGIPGLGGWFTTKAQSGGGAVIDISVHALDLSLYATGLWQPTAVSAKTYSKYGSPISDYHFVDMWAGPPRPEGTFDVDDYAAGLIRFGDKATLSFEVAWACNAQPENCIEILGDKGGVRLGGSDIVLATEFDNRPADIKIDYDRKNDGFAKELKLFCGAINGENDVPATGEQGVVLMKILDAIYQSSAENREITLA